jgi:hypothetical protein
MQATDHAQASWRPMVWKQNESGGLANGCASMPPVHAPEQSGQGGFLLAWAEDVQPVNKKTLRFAEESA